jgi:NTP pyrophosphatase (non-canonical NTP hydrolase)
MNETQHLLVILAEECAEVAQRASKAVRFGLLEVQPGQQENNVRRLERELADLLAVADLLGLNVRQDDKAAKYEKVKKFMEYSREIGTLHKSDRT